MARIIKAKRSRKKFDFGKVIICFFLVSLIGYFLSFTLIRSYNVSLAAKENKVALSIEKLENDVANLDIEVKQLDNRERILNIAKKNGLTVNQQNIVSVAKADDGE